jgi:hypothetical protein
VLVWANADMGVNVGELVPFSAQYRVFTMSPNIALLRYLYKFGVKLYTFGRFVYIFDLRRLTVTFEQVRV